MSSSWRQTPLNITTRDFVHLNACGYSPYATSSLTRGWVWLFINESHGFDSRRGNWILNWPNPSSRTVTLRSSRPLTEVSTRNFPGGKERPTRKADKHTAIWKMWELRRLRTLWASTACYKNSFTSFNLRIKYPMLLKILAFALYTSPVSDQVLQSRSCPSYLSYDTTAYSLKWS
jgi:hypothetical protein